jgi:hypothetical protein
MSTEDLNAGADAPSELDLMLEEADRTPLPSEAPAQAAKPEREDHDSGQNPSTALQETVEAGRQARESRPQHDNRVPLTELLNEREKRQNYERELERYRAEERRRAEEAARKPAPDMFGDPDAWQSHLREENQRVLREQSEAFNQQLLQVRLNTDEQMTRMRYATEFDPAMDWFKGVVQQNRGLYDQVMQAPSPHTAMVEMYKRESVLKEVGTDPAAYRQKLRDEALKDEEFLTKAYEAFQARAAGNQQWSPPQSARRPLPSLGRAGSAASPTAGSAGITTAEEAFGGR